MKDAKPLPLLGLVLTLLCGCQEAPQEPVQPPKPSFVVELSDADFLTKTRKGIVLLDAYAAWCGPCQWMEPHLEKVAETLQGKVMVARIDVDANQEFSRYFRIGPIPTLIVFVNGKQVEYSPGARSEKELHELVAEYINEPPTEPGPVGFPTQEEQ